MTDVISRTMISIYGFREGGGRYSGMDKYLGIDEHDLIYLSGEESSKRLVGMTPVELGFMSTGVAKGKGFSNKPIILNNIYAPKGTKMMYVEPFSEYGEGFQRAWDGISEQSSISSEAEMLFQRKTKFTITKVERSNGTIYIDMNVEGQRC